MNAKCILAIVLFASAMMIVDATVKIKIHKKVNR